MSIYLSADAPCARCRQPYGWCLNTCPENQRPKTTVPILAGPEMMAFGEIDLGDGRTHLVPVRQPGDWQSFPADRDPLDGLTITGVIRAVNEGPESHAEPRLGDGRVPVRYVVLLFLGLVLMGFGLAADPIGALIYGVIPR
jgi:hypothetical protein